MQSLGLKTASKLDVGFLGLYITVQDKPEQYEKARGKFIIDKSIMDILPKKSVIMHPLPRVDEVVPHKGRRKKLETLLYDQASPWS